MATTQGKELQNMQSESTTIEIQGDEFWSLSEKPFFHVILSKTHLRPAYRLVIPNKMYPILPLEEVPAILTYKGKEWNMLYQGDHRPNKKFSGDWRIFAADNELKVGDACVFELTECSTDLLKFRVQILRGDVPSQPKDSTHGEGKERVILID